MSFPPAFLKAPKRLPPLDPAFRPAALANRAFRDAVKQSGKGVPIAIGCGRGQGAFSVHRDEIFAPGTGHDEENLGYVERILKFLLWMKGGHRVVIGGPAPLADALRKIYAPGGARAFDFDFMAKVYEKPFVVESTSVDRMPTANEPSAPKGGHLDGCRIGLDLGASDRKVAAVVDGQVVHSEEVIWMPRDQKDPQWHFDEIMKALKSAAAHMPRVDALGVSSAGVYINDRVLVASLFRGVPPDLFEQRVKGIFFEAQKALGGVPLVVCNDGDVTALAGAMQLGEGAVLGVAMGSSEAAGYVTAKSHLTDWLSELAFAPFDYRPDAPVDEWSGDAGCGVQYFCQVGAIRLAGQGGLALPKEQTPAEKLKTIQAELAKGNAVARDVFKSIGVCFGHALAHYADFYDVKHVLILGRVTSGQGGQLILEETNAVLREEYPELAGRLKLHLPEEESDRRVGQAIAAASLPAIVKKGG